MDPPGPQSFTAMAGVQVMKDGLERLQTTTELLTQGLVWTFWQSYSNTQIIDQDQESPTCSKRPRAGWCGNLLREYLLHRCVSIIPVAFSPKAELMKRAIHLVSHEGNLPTFSGRVFAFLKKTTTVSWPSGKHRGKRKQKSRIPGEQVTESESFIYTVKVTSKFLRLSCSIVQ